jgi:hypothetical protein
MDFNAKCSRRRCSEIPWEKIKTIFLKKNPFEEPFFKMDGLRMIRIRPQRVSYAKGLGEGFKAEF